MSNYTGISLEMLDREISKREDILKYSNKKPRRSANSCSKSPTRNDKENYIDNLNRNISKSHIIPSPYTQKDSQYTNVNQNSEPNVHMGVFQTKSMYIAPEQNNSTYASNNLSNNLPQYSQFHQTYENETSYSNLGILYCFNKFRKK